MNAVNLPRSYSETLHSAKDSRVEADHRRNGGWSQNNLSDRVGGFQNYAKGFLNLATVWRDSVSRSLLRYLHQKSVYCKDEKSN